MNKKQKFYYQAKQLFDEDVLKEIYSTDNISLCNVGNAYYIVFLVGDIYKGKNIEFMGLLDEEVEFVMQNEENLTHIYQSRPKENKMLYIFDERACNTMRNSRNRILQNGPQINLEEEAKLIEKYGQKKMR